MFRVFLKIALIFATSFFILSCEALKKYECTITDAEGNVIKKVKVNYESECAALALGV